MLIYTSTFKALSIPLMTSLNYMNYRVMWFCKPTAAGILSFHISSNWLKNTRLLVVNYGVSACRHNFEDFRQTLISFVSVDRGRTDSVVV